MIEVDVRVYIPMYGLVGPVPGKLAVITDSQKASLFSPVAGLTVKPNPCLKQYGSKLPGPLIAHDIQEAKI